MNEEEKRERIRALTEFGLEERKLRPFHVVAGTGGLSIIAIALLSIIL